MCVLGYPFSLSVYDDQCRFFLDSPFMQGLMCLVHLGVMCSGKDGY